MGIRFIGNKQRLLPLIREKVLTTVGRTPNQFADLFSGTTSVARAFKQLGSYVIANDLLKSSEVFATAALKISDVPSFQTLMHEGLLQRPNIGFWDDPLDHVLSYLNNLEGTEGFFYRAYAPTGSAQLGTRRQYFTDANACKIDAIRATIRYWWKQNLISDLEHALLLSSLMLATNTVANVAGTYGYFLKTWYDRALEPLRLERPVITPGSTNHEIYREDANILAKRISAEVVYLDPPYTKRQYSAYYHILETLAEDDEPEVWGATGLRPRSLEEQWSSRYCYKQEAARALQELVDQLACRYIFLSYSSDGHIPNEALVEILKRRGPVTVWSVSLPRYKSNNGGGMRAALQEQLFVVECLH